MVEGQIERGDGGAGQGRADGRDALSELLAQDGPVRDGGGGAPPGGVRGELEGADVCLRDDVPLEVG